MRKGARKRSASQRATESLPEGQTELTAEATGGGLRPKRVRASRRVAAEPEFFEDKRNLEDLWMAAFPVGTEWDQLDNVYQIKWNFTNLEEAFEEGGKLYGKRVYLFGYTEPQLVSFRGEMKIIFIPAIVAVVSPFPPSDKIGINSVQRESEKIIPTKQMKMDWVQFISFDDRGRQVDRLKSEIFIMSRTQRRAALKHLKIDRVKKYEYCLPYFKDPFKKGKDEQSTMVTVLFPAEPPVFCEYNWELDEYVAFLKEKVEEGEKANDEAREARRKALEEMSEETRSGFENMKIYKFYPITTPDTPDISNSK